mgnify:CR=1 FL=1
MLKHTMVALLTTFCLLHTQAQTISAQPNYTNRQRTIEVMGSAELELVPNEIYVQVTLREYQRKNEPKVNLETLKTRFLAACRQAGLPDTAITVAAYQGYDRWQWRSQRRTPDMMATISYQLLFSNTAQMDKLVDLLDDEGTAAFTITRTSHSQLAEYRKQLKIEAVKAARAKAMYLSEAIGEKTGKALTITEPQEMHGPHQPIASQTYLANAPLKPMDLAGMPNEGDGINFKKLKLRYEVLVVFELE